MQNNTKNILIITKFDGTYMTNWQKEHFIEELIGHGWQINIFNYNSDDKTCLQDNINLIIHKRIDFVVWTISEKPETIPFLELLKTMGIPCVLITFDNTHNPYLHKSSIKYFDLIYLTSPENKSYYDQYGAKKIMIGAYAANPGNFQPKWKSNQNHVSFIGSIYGFRKKVIHEILESNIPLLITKEPYMMNNIPKILKDETRNIPRISSILRKCNDPIQRKLILSKILSFYFEYKLEDFDMNSECLKLIQPPNFQNLRRIYEECKLSLNVAELRNTGYLRSPIYKLHLRTFEIPMFGGLQLMKDNPLIRNYFEPDKEIILYQNFTELKEKCIFYLKPQNTEIVNKLKFNAYNRATKDHCWINRFSDISNSLI